MWTRTCCQWVFKTSAGGALTDVSQCLTCVLCVISAAAVRSHSTNNLLDPTDAYSEQTENRTYGDATPSATSNRRASVDVRPSSPAPEKRSDPASELKPSQTKSYNEHPPPPPPPPPLPSSSTFPSQSVRRGSVDFRPVSPHPDKKSELGSDVQVWSRSSSVGLTYLVVCNNTSFLFRVCHRRAHLKTVCFQGRFLCTSLYYSVIFFVLEEVEYTWRVCVTFLIVLIVSEAPTHLPQ